MLPFLRPINGVKTLLKNLHVEFVTPISLVGGGGIWLVHF